METDREINSLDQEKISCLDLALSASSPAEWFARTLFKTYLYTVLFLPLSGAGK